ncbi:MAG: OmpA family protein [Bacteroidota bacterium]
MKQIVFLILCAFGSVAMAQNAYIERANGYFDKEAYPDAIRMYEKGFAQDDKDAVTDWQTAKEHLAESYYALRETEKAEMWYARATKQSKKAEVHYAFGQVLKSNGKYDEASEAFLRYGELSRDVKGARAMVEACEEARDLLESPEGWTLSPLDVNTAASDFGPVVLGQDLMFASARPRGFWSRFLNMRNRNLFYDLYRAGRKGPVSFETPKLVRGALKSRFHDGPVTFTKDQNTVYFTRSNHRAGKLQRDDNNRAHLTIYRAELSGKKYRKARALPFNDDAYSCGHPALDPKGKFLIFSSDMPGGQGGSDLYMVERKGDSWGQPVNLGPQVNTAGDEMFPYLGWNGQLFFASDGHAGLGGLDIFSSTLENGQYGGAVNLGIPLNSAQDDFSLVWTKGGRGYFSSNREGVDNLYFFQRKVPAELLVVNSQTGQPVEGASVRVLGVDSKEIRGATDAAGQFAFEGKWNAGYRVSVEMEDHAPTQMQFATGNRSVAGPQQVEVPLRKYLIVEVDGNVAEADGGKAVAAASISLEGERNDLDLRSDAQGNFASRVDTLSDYTAVTLRSGYIPTIQEFSTRGIEVETDLPLRVRMRKGKYLYVTGLTVDKQSGEPVSGASLRVFEESQEKVIYDLKSRPDGKFHLVLEEGKDMHLIGTGLGYFSSRLELPAFDEPGDSTLRATVELVPFEVGALVKVIYFPYRETSLVRAARKELNEIVAFMLENPEVSVQLAAHTDARGGDDYNQRLSEARAKAAVDYIVRQGITRERISSAGFGEQQLLNKCQDGVECEEEQHQENRRAEVKVVKIEEAK